MPYTLVKTIPRRYVDCFLVCMIIVLSIPSGSCKKKPFSYRNKYTGDFHFVKKETPWLRFGGTFSTTVSEYNGTVNYVYESGKENRKDIQIMVGPENVQNYFIEKDGSLSLTCGDGDAGRFVSKDKLELNLPYCPSGLGGGVNISIVGTRIKK